MDLGDILGQKQKLVKHIEVQFSLAINQIKEPKKQTFEFHLQKGRKAFFFYVSECLEFLFRGQKILQIFCWWICFFFRSLIVFTFTFFPQILGNFSTHAHRLNTHTYTFIPKSLRRFSFAGKRFFPDVTFSLFYTGRRTIIVYHLHNLILLLICPILNC